MDKARKTAAAISRLMPNVGGAGHFERRVLYTAVEAQLLYGVQVWSGVMGWKKYKEELIAVQRKMALRVISVYRTVSTAASLVLASISLIDLVGEERMKSYEKMKNVTPEARKKARVEVGKEEKANVMKRWQQR
ncbi:uncharacterized protein [Chelonus insularis]|uniref:uncharacterized protein n=1 Tax=Chelonus insularis TaxID=460826 RepID=UPI00158CEAE3|nr:uncharacterized protein LOC118070171 [Chelonus insularis]